MDPTEIMNEPAPSMAKPRKKKKGKRYNQLSAGNPKHHLVHVHVNVVNTAAGDGSGQKKKSDNEADSALRNLRGF